MKPSNFLIKVLDNSKCCKKIKQTDNVFNLSFQKQPCPYAREREKPSYIPNALSGVDRP